MPRLKLGAAHVIAVDLDPQALLATRDNADRNGVAAQHRDARRCRTPEAASSLQPAYCVRGQYSRRPLDRTGADADGRLRDRTATCCCRACSKTQAYAVKAAYALAFDMVQVIERDDWCCIYARRAG